VLTACLGKVEGVKSEGGFTEQLCSDLREAMVNMVDREVYHTRGSTCPLVLGMHHLECDERN